jgi:hypothetical protein
MAQSIFKQAPDPNGISCGATRPQPLRSRRIPRLRPMRPFFAVGLLRLSLLLLLSGAAGCWGSADERLNKALAQASMQRQAVSPFAGTVTIDGLPPSFSEGFTFEVKLTDASKLDAPAYDCWQAWCKSDGEFSFSTYKPNDGVPAPKTYVITFAVLAEDDRGSVGPDQLKDLYNDPEKNAKNPQFVIEHTARGKSDYKFDLKVADVPPGSLGPHSMTGRIKRGK